MSGTLSGNYTTFLVRVRKLACTMQPSSDLRSVENLKRKRGDICYFDTTFRQRRSNQCHKSISHTNAYRDLRDAMRSHARKYLPNSQNNGIPCESNKFDTR